MKFTFQTSPRSISKLIGFVVVSGLCVLCLQLIDQEALKDINSMSPADFIANEKSLHQEPIALKFLTILIMGGIYLGLIELVSFLVRLVAPSKKTPPDATI